MVKKFNIIQFNPEELPWKKNNWCSNWAQVFYSKWGCKKHIKRGQIGNNICAYKSVDIPNVVHGVNSADGKTDVFSCASCTNNISPVVEVPCRIGIKKSYNDNNSFTQQQAIVDAPSKKEL
jgi:glyceraldehyde 3-phosphate dehydrogenase